MPAICRSFSPRRLRLGTLPIRPCVYGCSGRSSTASASTGLHDAAGVHHGDLVGEAGDHRQIVRDPDQPGAVGCRELLHLGQNLRLYGDVQRRGRLVGDQQIGMMQQRDGDRHALPHAAGELMRIGCETFIGAGDPDHAKGIARTRARLGVRDLGVRPHRLDHLRVDAQDRIERHHRVLEDHRDAVAAQGAHLALGEFREILALVQDRAADNASRWIDQADDGEAGDRLAGAGLADQSQHLSARDGERHVVHRLHHAGAREEMRAQVAHFEGRGGHRCSRGFSTSRN